jgi:hypothetical protein
VWLTAGCPEVAAGHKEEEVGGKFTIEVKLLSQLRHCNGVCMLGYVSNNLDTMVLYVYMVNDSLWEALHGKGKSKMLDEWVPWYNVAAHLTYLHQYYRLSVIHRDIKSSWSLSMMRPMSSLAGSGSGYAATSGWRSCSRRGRQRSRGPYSGGDVVHRGVVHDQVPQGLVHDAGRGHHARRGPAVAEEQQ